MAGKAMILNLKLPRIPIDGVIMDRLLVIRAMGAPI